MNKKEWLNKIQDVENELVDAGVNIKIKKVFKTNGDLLRIYGVYKAKIAELTLPDFWADSMKEETFRDTFINLAYENIKEISLDIEAQANQLIELNPKNGC